MAAATTPPSRRWRGGRIGAAVSILALSSAVVAARARTSAFCPGPHRDARSTRCGQRKNDRRTFALGASLQTPTPTESSSSTASSTAKRPSLHTIPSNVIPFPPADDAPQSHVLAVEDMGPALKFSKNGKLKVLNLTGLHHLAVILLTLPFWMMAMETLHRLGDAIEGFDDHRAKFDYSGKIWCRTYLRLTDCYPEIAGDVDRLKADAGNGACLFVANHASFLDIAVLCCAVDPVFKFIAKDSLKDFPGVGMQLTGGDHVLIDRSNKRSQLRSFKDAVKYLKDGVPIMAFPEGARSPDGRLMEFKGGIFSMAVKAGVPIVPLSLANTHAVMPSEGLVPVQSGKGKLRVFVHEAIGVEGKSEEEISAEVRAALLSELPSDQHPLEEP